ncbi:translocation/assembly module TamB domain-containing protein [Octadecabacter ascidiaceicola]|uniref:Translocation and assembly module TamB n=1 Tax=Octadecabacter ascidiaceicola TaxID=1655543 RepID=A0A238JTE4_9RHOB|nr:translocation/assembly module TamB domain-containing protein [Octadecabacter ascidiaceicola]SMX33855.1 Translocation and assembly module TamB [Octadecabacter ascidiaceicola]
MRFLFGLLFVVWAGGAFAQTTEEDRDYITGLIEDTISNDEMIVRLVNFEGALSSEATVDAITIADPDGVWLRFEALTLQWNRSALLSGRIEVETLSAERIELIRLPATNETAADLPSAEATPFSLPDLPVSIDLNSVSADEIVLPEDLLGEPITARLNASLRLGEGAGDTDFTLERTDGKTGRFIVDASFENETRRLALNFLAQEGQNGIAARLLSLPDNPSVKLEIIGDAPLDEFTGNIALATNDVERVTGTVVLSRSVDSTDQDFNIDLAGDLRPMLADQYDPFFGEQAILRVQGTVPSGGGVQLSNLLIAADQVVLRGSANIDAQGWPETIDLRGRLGSGGANRVLLPIAGDPIEVSEMSLNVQYDEANGETWTGAFDITSLTQTGVSVGALTLSGGGVISPSINATRGRFSADLNYAARGLVFDDAALSEAIGTDIDGTLNVGRLSDGPFVVRELTLAGAGIQAFGLAYINGPGERFNTRAELSVTADDFTRFAALTGVELAGNGTIALSGTALPFDGIFDFDIDASTRDLALGIPEADPLLAGEGTLALQIARDTTGTRLSEINIRNEAVVATGDAEITAQSAAANFTAQITDLNILAPELSGPATLTADVKTDSEGVIALDADVAAPHISASTVGTASPHENGYVLQTDTTLSVSDLSAYGNVAGQRLGGGLTVELDGIYSTNTGVLSADIAARTQDLRAGPAVLDRVFAGLGRVSANVGLSESRRLRIDALNAVFPNLTANGAVVTSGSDTTANLSVRLRDIAVLVSDFSGPLVAEISANQDASGWNVTGDATGPAGTAARATGRVSNSGQLDVNINGSAPLALANVYIDPRQISGLAQFDLTVNGPPALSSVRGPVTISGARLVAPNLRQAIEDLNGTLQLAGGTARLDLRAASADGGALTLSGPVDLVPPFQAALNAQLTDVVLRDPTLYRTTANGLVTINGPLTGGAQIAGTIDVGAAEVQVPSTGVSALGSLPEVTHLGPRMDVQQTLARAGVNTAPVTEQATIAGPDFPINLLIRVPSRIFVRGRGLDAELGGQLRLTGSLNNLIPIGRFDLVRGRLNILGQRFELDEGYAQLQGDFSPFLRLVATTETATGTMVSIIVEGPAEDIEVRFESSPELPQDEVLAQLLFGRDLSSISPLQAVQLASAVATLAGTGGANGGVVGNLREGLDLDDLDFVTSEDGTAAVRAGKYISDNVYTDVTVGANGNSEININIDIDRNFTARGSVGSDGETSVGIFFERDY